MPTITFETINDTQINGLLSYMQKENIKFEIFEPEDEFLYNEMLSSEISGVGDFNKVMEFLQS